MIPNGLSTSTGSGSGWVRRGRWSTSASVVWTLGRSSPARRRLIAPVVVPCAVYLGVVAWSYLVQHVGFIGSGEPRTAALARRGGGLAAVAGGIGWGEWRARRMRSVVAGITLRARSLRRPRRPPRTRSPESSATPSSTSSTDRRTAARRRRRRSRPLRPSDGRTVTPLVSGGQPWRRWSTGAACSTTRCSSRRCVAAAGLALEHERLHAELLAQERELRASRARIVAAGDSERRSLERNLHDGSQQRLIGLLLSARYAQSLLGAGAGEAVQARVDRLVAELELSIDELRRIAHGIHPAVLTDEGLAAAIESLADDVDTLSIGPMPDERFPARIEQVAYRVVAEAAATGPARVSAAHVDGTLVVDVEAERLPDDLVDVEDRVSAADGVIATGHTIDGTVTMKVELPCG